MADPNDDASLVDRGKTAVERAKTLKERFDLTHAGRTVTRYSDRNGNVIAGGIAYFSLASIAAGVLIAVSVASWLIAGNPQWSAAIFDFIDSAIPGVVAQDGQNGIVDPSALEPTAITGIVGFVAFIILINTASRYVSGMRTGVWAMLNAGDRSPLQGKLRDFAALLGIAILVLVGAGLQVATSIVADQLSQLIFDEPPEEWTVRLLGALVLLVVDAAFAAIVLVFLGGVRVERRYIVWTLLIVATLMALLRQGFSLFVSGASNNPVLGPFAAIVTLLLFVNFTARILLLAAAYLGTFRTQGPLTVDDLSEEFTTWATDTVGATVAEGSPGHVVVDPGPAELAVDLWRDDSGVVTVTLVPTIGSEWAVMETESTSVAERHIVFALAHVARERAGVTQRLVVRSGAGSTLPGVRLGSSDDEDFPFVVEFGDDELARFARASDAREAGLYLAAPLAEITEAVITPDGGALLGLPPGEKLTLGDRLRARLRL